MSGQANGGGPQIEHGVARLAVSKAEAAEALGVSVDFLENHVMDDLRIVRRGRGRADSRCASWSAG